MIALGSDHGGFALKEKIKDYLDAHGLEHRDFGCADESSCDYPVYAKAAAEAVASGQCSRGIVICTTGIGHLHRRQQSQGRPAVPCARIR